MLTPPAVLPHPGRRRSPASRRSPGLVRYQVLLLVSTGGGMDLPERAGGSWTLLTGHGHVLVEMARNTRAQIGDIAAAAGLTERTVQAIIADLEAAG